MPKTAPIAVVELNSEVIDTAHIFDAWREGIAPLFYSDPKADHDPKKLGSKFGLVGNVLVSKGSYSSQEFIRDKKHLQQNDDADHILLQWYTKGGCHVTNGKKSFIQSPENIVVMDLGYESFSTTFAPHSEMYSLVFPREVLQEFWGPIDSLAGLQIPSNSVKGLLLRNFMVNLCDNLDQVDISEASAISESACQIFSSLFQNEIKHAIDKHEPLSTNLKSEIKKFILVNIRDPHLGAELLAHRFHCSRAKIYRLFQKEGGLANYIYSQRLRLCYKELSQTPRNTRAYDQMISSWGFKNTKQFNRRFNNEFGQSAKEMIAETKQFASTNSNGHAMEVASWLKKLSGHL